MKILLGIDIGTSGVKAVALSTAGKVVACAYNEIDFEIPQPNYAEQSPELWWYFSTKSVKSVVEEIGEKAKIVGIGITGQMHGTVFVDEKINPIHKAIIWCDGRSTSLLQNLNKEIEGKYTSSLQNPMVTGVQATTIYWFKQFRKDILERTKYILLPKDYIRYRMTGKLGSDYSDAAGTMLFDVQKKKWDEELINIVGAKKEMFPEVFSSSEIAGETNLEFEALTGVPCGTKVCFGGGDAQCQSFALGLGDQGAILSSVRSGGDVVAVTNQFVRDPEMRHLTLNHVVEGQYIQLAATLTSGLSLKWMCNELVERMDFSDADDIARERLPKIDLPIFLPYLSGERTPLLDPYAKGMFFGLTLKHNKEDLVTSVMEGIIFSLKSCLDLLYSINVEGDRLIVSGGGAKSDVFKQLWADVFDMPVYCSLLTDQAPIGAAMLAGVAVGIYKSYQEAIKIVCKTSNEAVLPNPKSNEIYEKRYKIFSDLYFANRDIFKEMNDIQCD